MVKAGCLGALLGGMAGCLAGGMITAPHVSRGMSDPGFLTAFCMFLGAAAGMAFGMVVQTVRSRKGGPR